jgi:hypothetical protein
MTAIARSDFEAWIRIRARPTGTDRYAVALPLLLAGYALFGKAFAYIGIAPIFVGEIMLVLGCLALLRTGCIFSPLTTLPSIAIMALLMWVLARTMPFIGSHGVDALRDSVVATYGVFAFVVIALLLERPERLDGAVDLLAVFVRYGLPVAVVMYLIGRFGAPYLPFVPGTNVEIISIRAGEIGVHLCGGLMFVTLGLVRVGRVWWLVVLAAVLLLATQNRGALLSILIPVSVGMVIGGHRGRLVGISVLSIACLGAAWLADLRIEFPRGDRPVSAEALVNNLLSVFWVDPSADADGTKLWRLRWWETIRGYTLFGPFFWTGKGFGMNLAVVDGFVVGTEHGGALVRSPHSVHMTYLARAGLPGLLLWWLVCVTWFGMVARNMLAARRAGAAHWASLFLFLACYVASMLINASVDVALEGPMLGIWLWTIMGLGIGASMIYRAPKVVRTGD